MAYNARLKPELYLFVFPLWGMIAFGFALACAFAASNGGAAEPWWWCASAVAGFISWVTVIKKEEMRYFSLHYLTWMETRASAREGNEE